MIVNWDLFSRFMLLVERKILFPPDYKIWIKPFVNCALPSRLTLTHSTGSRGKDVRRRTANQKMATPVQGANVFASVERSERLSKIEPKTRKNPPDWSRWRRKRTFRVEHALRRSHPSTSGLLPCLVPRTKTGSPATYTRTLMQARG